MSITSFVWRTGSVLDPNERQSLGQHAVLGPRIAITVLLFLGLLYFGLIIATLRRYGEPSACARRPGGDAEAQTETQPRRGRTLDRTPSGRGTKGGTAGGSTGEDIEKAAGNQVDVANAWTGVNVEAQMDRVVPSSSVPSVPQ
jgi:hypothetical protein